MNNPEDRKRKGALIFIHVKNESSCTFGKTLDQRGYRLKNIYVPSADLNTIDPLRPDLMIIMGGPIGVYQADDYPFLDQEIEILKQRIANDLPTIGICLGSQLIAAALDSKVYPGDNGTELGWSPLEISEDAKGTAIEHLCGCQTNMFHWHGDTFDLPQGAQLLASSPRYPHQVFQHGKNILGIQAHPEVQHAQLEEWAVTFCGDVSGPNAKLPITKLREDTNQHIEKLNTQARLFLNAWLDERGM